MFSSAVQQLMRLEMPRYDEKWLNYSTLGIGPDDNESLKELASPAAVTRGPLGATVFAPAAHSWRAMAQMRTPGAVPLILDLLATVEALPDEAETMEDSTSWVLNESATVLGEFGPDALPELLSCIENESFTHWVRGRCADAVAIIAQKHPESRAKVTNVLARTLARFLTHDPYFTYNIIQCLVNMKAWENSAAPQEGRSILDLMKRVVACEPGMDGDVELWPAFLYSEWRGQGSLLEMDLCDEAPFVLLSNIGNQPERAPVQRLFSLRAPLDEEEWFDYTDFGIGGEDIPEMLKMLEEWTPRFSCTCLGRNVAVLHCCRALAQMRSVVAIEPLFRFVSRAMAQDKTQAFGALLMESRLMAPYGALAVEPLLRILESPNEPAPDRLRAVKILLPAFPAAGFDLFRETVFRVAAVQQSSNTSPQLREELEEALHIIRHPREGGDPWSSHDETGFPPSRE